MNDPGRWVALGLALLLAALAVFARPRPRTITWIAALVLPATLLVRLARDERFPGVGSLLLVDALARAHKQSEQIASLAVIADAKDEAALNFYRKFGFAALGSHPNRVFLPMGTVKELLQLKC